MSETEVSDNEEETTWADINDLLYKVTALRISSTEDLIRMKELELLALNVRLKTYKENELILKDNKHVREFILNENETCFACKQPLAETSLPHQFQ